MIKYKIIDPTPRSLSFSFCFGDLTVTISGKEEPIRADTISVCKDLRGNVVAVIAMPGGTQVREFLRLDTPESKYKGLTYWLEVEAV